MLRRILKINKTKQPMFQVLFLRNDTNQEVEVHETSQLDFLALQQHLKCGESVFITSKSAQKLKLSKPKSLVDNHHSKARLATAVFFEGV